MLLHAVIIFGGVAPLRSWHPPPHSADMERLKWEEWALLTTYQSLVSFELWCLSFLLNSNKYNGQLNLFPRLLYAFYVFSYLMLLGKFHICNKILQKVKVLTLNTENLQFFIYDSFLKFQRALAAAIALERLKRSRHSPVGSFYYFQGTYVSVGFPDVYLWWLWWQGGAACVFLLKNISCNMILTPCVCLSVIFPSPQASTHLRPISLRAWFEGIWEESAFWRLHRMKQIRQWSRICILKTVAAYAARQR